MLSKIKEKVRKPFYQGSLVVLLGNILTGFFNYLYHLITGRFLPPDQYGLLESLIALTYFLYVFTQALSFSIINFVSQIGKSQVASLVLKLQKEVFKFSLFFWLCALGAFPVFKRFLHLRNFWVFFIFSLQVPFYFLPTVYYSVLQARLKFLAFSSVAVLSTLAKLIFAFLFLYLGWQVSGALWGLVVGGILAILLGKFLVLKYWPKEAEGLAKKVSLDRSFLSYSLLSLVTNLTLISLYSSDIVLVRYYFSSHKSGIYSALSVLGKIIFFTATAILLVSFPLFTKFKKDKQKLRQTFWLSFLFLGALCGIGTAIFKLFPDLVVSLLYGEGFKEAAFLLSPFAIFVSFLAFFNLFLQFLLALEEKVVVFLGGFVASGQIILTIFRHQTLKMVIYNSIASLIAGLFFGFWPIFKIIYEKKE